MMKHLSRLCILFALSLPVIGSAGELRPVAGAAFNFGVSGFCSPTTGFNTAGSGVGNATFQSAVTAFSDGYNFNGTTNARGDVAFSSRLQATTIITLGMWVNLTNVSAISCLLQNGTAESATTIADNYRFLSLSSGKFSFLYGSNGLTNLRQATLDTFTNTVGTWTHVSVSYQWPALTSIVFRVNGATYDNSSVTWVDGNGAGTSTNLGAIVSTNSLRIGHRYFAGRLQPTQGSIAGGPWMVTRKITAEENLDIMRRTRPAGAFR